MSTTKHLTFLIMFLACGEIDNEFYHGKDPTEVFYVKEFGENFRVEENVLGNFSMAGEGGVSENFNATKGLDREMGHFSQNEEKIVTESVKKADIIWVIDNSGSMRNDQRRLANNFSLFIEDFAKKDIDFKMAIITTDSRSNKDTENRLNSAELKRNKSDFISYFKSKIQVGVSGSQHEKAFKYTKLFLENNTTWSRSGSLLIFIFVSDEEEGGDSPIHANSPVQNYTNAFATSKGGLENIRAFSICEITSCNRFEEISRSTGGLTRYIDGDFANISKEFGESIVRDLTNLKKVFKLNITPTNPDGLRVEVNGSSVPKDDTGTSGWRYDISTNSIRFFGSHVPPASAGIRVHEVGTVQSTFKIVEKIDSAMLSTLVVKVNGQNVPRDTTEKNGWNYHGTTNSIKFFGNYRPSQGEEVVITLPGKAANFIPLRKDINTNHLDKVEVTVNGNLIPQDNTKRNGWAYNAQNRTIEFFGNYALLDGDKVKVSLGMKSRFCLQQGFDLSKIDEVDVLAGGRSIPRDMTGNNGWDYNQSSMCIELYGNHGLTSGLPVKISWGQRTKFCLGKPLDEKKLETVVIKVDGSVIERGGSGTGWDYDDNSNCISFFGSQMPDINSKIEITYTPSYRKKN